jgi:hypothetical protein
MCEGASQRANKFSESVEPTGLAKRAERVSRRSGGAGSNTLLVRIRHAKLAPARRKTKTA